MDEGEHVTLFKALNGLEPANGGTGRYPGAGRWTRHLDPDRLEACSYGYHLAQDAQLLDWLAPTVYEAEACPDHPLVDAGDKMVSCRVRLTRKLNWDDRIARLFAADCAEAALLGERASGREPDVRSWAAVTALRQYANGEITDAAWAAAWDPGWAAARAAAWDPGWAAARAAAWDAARDPARDAALATQYDRLVLYLYDKPLPPVEALYGTGVGRLKGEPE